MIKGKIGSSSGLSGAPTIMSFPCDFKRPIRGRRGWTTATVSMIPSNVPCATYIVEEVRKLIN